MHGATKTSPGVTQGWTPEISIDPTGTTAAPPSFFGKSRCSSPPTNAASAAHRPPNPVAAATPRCPSPPGLGVLLSGLELKLEELIQCAARLRRLGGRDRRVPKAEVWRRLAAETLAVAQKATDHDAKLTLTAIALAYEKLARRARRRAQGAWRKARRRCVIVKSPRPRDRLREPALSWSSFEDDQDRSAILAAPSR
jgi:hypothetical protein